MDREERELFQNLLDRLDAQSGPTTSGPTQQSSVNPLTPKQERPTIYNIGRTSMFGGNVSNMMPDPKFFRKLLGIDL